MKVYDHEGSKQNRVEGTIPTRQDGLPERLY
jgi:hypothetical protein